MPLSKVSNSQMPKVAEQGSSDTSLHLNVKCMLNRAYKNSHFPLPSSSLNSPQTSHKNVSADKPQKSHLLVSTRKYFQAATLKASRRYRIECSRQGWVKRDRKHLYISSASLFTQQSWPTTTDYPPPRKITAFQKALINHFY